MERSGGPEDIPAADFDATATPTPSPPGHGRTCFVIGPIGNKFAPVGSEERTTYEEAVEVFEEVIVAACSAPSVGLEPVRADGLSIAGELTEQIFGRLRDDDVVIADLTGANPNVMYELGLRHTRNKLTVQLGEFSRLPFDINVIRTVMFSRSPNGLVNARKELQEILEAGLAGEWDPVSATRVWNGLSDDDGGPVTGPGQQPPDGPSPAVPDASESQRAAEERSVDDESAGLMDKLADAEDAQDLLLSAANGITAQLELLASLADEQAAKLADSDARGLGMRGRLAHVLSFANQLDHVADNLELQVQNYVRAMGKVGVGYTALVDFVEQEDPEQLNTPEVRELGETIRRTAVTSRESLAGLSDLVETMTDTARFAKALRRPTSRVAAALNDFANATEVLNELDRRLQLLGIDLAPADDEGSNGVTDDTPPGPASDGTD